MHEPKFKLFQKVALSSTMTKYDNNLKINVPLTDDELDMVYEVVGMFVRTHYNFNDWEYLLYPQNWENMGEYGNHGSQSVSEDKIITLTEAKERRLIKAQKKLKDAEKFYKECLERSF